MLDQDQRRRGVVGDVLEHIPTLFLGEDVYAARGLYLLGSLDGACLCPLLALYSQADQGAELDRRPRSLPAR